MVEKRSFNQREQKEVPAKVINLAKVLVPKPKSVDQITISLEEAARHHEAIMQRNLERVTPSK